MNKRRLLTLAKFLEEKVPPKRFDMERWAKRDAGVDPNNLDLCGTTACALGWATMIPSFRRAGLSLRVDAFCPTRGTVEYNGEYNVGAASGFFEVPLEDAYRIFQPDNLRFYKMSAPRTAKRIRRFVETNGKSAS